MTYMRGAVRLVLREREEGGRDGSELAAALSSGLRLAVVGEVVSTPLNLASW